MNTIVIYTGLATAAALVGGYYLGIFSGQRRDIVTSALIALNLAITFCLVGLPVMAAALVVICFVAATAFGVAVTGRIRPADAIDRGLPILLGITTVFNIIALVCTIVANYPAK